MKMWRNWHLNLNLVLRRIIRVKPKLKVNQSENLKDKAMCDVDGNN